MEPNFTGVLQHVVAVTTLHVSCINLGQILTQCCDSAVGITKITERSAESG